MSTDWRWCADAPREAASLIDEQRQGLAALRAENTRLRDEVSDLDAVHELADTLRERAHAFANERDALRAEVERLTNACRSYDEQANRDRIEVERLRAALEGLMPAPWATAEYREAFATAISVLNRDADPTTESRQDCVQCEGYGKVIGCLTGAKYDCENCNGTGSVVVL